ncbi:MAG: response regulator [Verrucomicrobiia bacterium]|jgi:DNA-binding response OmpR family regulator
MPNLLLVEDNQHIQRIFHDKLQREGFTVTTAEDGELGLQRATETHPDVILLDIMLPRMDGFEVLTHLHDDPALSVIPVFMLSNRSTGNDVQHAISLGARHFFAKGGSTMQDMVLQIRTTCGFKKVLVSTSNVMTAAPIMRALTHPRVLCSVITVPAEILGAAERGAPDVIVLDARAPNAFNLLQQFKTSAAVKNIPLIAIRDPKQTQQRLEEFIDSDRIATDLRPVVLKHLGVEEPATTPTPAAQPVAAVT